MAKAMYSAITGLADLFAVPPVALVGATADSTAKVDVGRSADILLLPAVAFAGRTKAYIK